MKVLIYSFLLIGIILISTPAFATVKNITNVTNVTKVEQAGHKAWDYGIAGDVVLYETANSEWGVRADHLIESSETRGYLTGKVYLNRATYQKK